MKGHGKRGAVCDRALKVMSAGLEVKAVLRLDYDVGTGDPLRQRRTVSCNARVSGHTDVIPGPFCVPSC
jgi:hypothetical protein